MSGGTARRLLLPSPQSPQQVDEPIDVVLVLIDAKPILKTSPRTSVMQLRAFSSLYQRCAFGLRKARKRACGPPSTGFSNSASPSTVPEMPSRSCCCRFAQCAEMRDVVRPISASMRRIAVNRYSADGSKVAPRKRLASRACADATRRERQVLELGETTGNRRAGAKALRRAHERAALARHRI
jgi:hypothetical protein